MLVLDSLTDEQLREIDSVSRASIIKRLEMIQGVQDQLSGVQVQLSQILSSIPDSYPTATREGSGSSGSGDVEAPNATLP